VDGRVTSAALTAAEAVLLLQERLLLLLLLLLRLPSVGLRVAPAQPTGHDCCR
jgi:hypothetical protein